MRLIYTFNVTASGHDCGTIFSYRDTKSEEDVRWVWRHHGGYAIRRFKNLKEVYDHFGLLARVDRFSLEVGITGPLEEL